MLITLLFLTGVEISFGQAGQPDPSFGNKGIVATDFGFNYSHNYSAQATQVLLQTDGRMYILVQSDFFFCIAKRLSGGAPSLGYGNALTRYSNDGSLDAGFPGSDFWRREIGTIGSIALQTDGKMVALVDGLQLRRYNADGNPDKTFGSDGIQTIGGAGLHSWEVTGITISDNKLFTAGFGQLPGCLGVIESYLLNNEKQIPPIVSLTFPANNATYLSGSNVYLTAVATDADALPVKTVIVRTFDNGKLLLRLTCKHLKS